MTSTSGDCSISHHVSKALRRRPSLALETMLRFEPFYAAVSVRQELAGRRLRGVGHDKVSLPEVAVKWVSQIGAVTYIARGVVLFDA